MLKINYELLFIICTHLCIIVYLFLLQFTAFILFYPVGIITSLFILYWVRYAILKAGLIVLNAVKYFYYLWSLYTNYLDLPQLKSFQIPIECLTNFLHNYSDYFFVFQVKKIWVYIYWLLVILLFI